MFAPIICVFIPGSATHRHAHKIQHFRNLLIEYSFKDVIQVPTR